MRRLKPLAALLAGLLAVAPLVGEPRAAAADAPLRYLAGGYGTLDPAFIADQADVMLLLQLYAGLTRLDETGEPYPSLAEGWRVSDDGRTYTFRIRAGLRFSDGTPLDATDVRRSWLRLLDPETGATAPDVLGVVEGARERQRGDVAEDAVGIEAPDPRTLVVRLRHPAAHFPAITATPTTFVVPAAADGSGSWQTPEAFVGSGPYVVDGTDGPDLVLRANEAYVAGPPPIAEVRWVGAVEGDPVSAFSGGELDLAAISPADATWIRFDPSLGPRLHRSEALTVTYLAFDTTSPPFDDPRVRRALALALDRERLVPLALGAGGQPAGSLVPPAIWPDGFAPDVGADLEAARALLADAGHPGGDGLGTITVNGTGADVAPIVAAWTDGLGLDVETEIMEGAVYFRSLEEEPPQVYTVTWIADYPSPYALYSLLLLPGALSNWGRWDDARFVELLETAGAAVDDAERARAYAAVEAHVADQAPVIPWAYDASWWLVGDGLRGLGNLTLGLIDFGRVSWDG